MANYDGLTKNDWPGTWVPSSEHPIALSNEIRGGLHVVSGEAGDTLTDISGQRLAEGMLVYNTSDSRYYMYTLLDGETRNSSTGYMPNNSGNWSVFSTSNLENDSSFITQETFVTDFGLITQNGFGGVTANVDANLINISSFVNDSGYALLTDLAPVATTGSYSSLIDQPTLFSGNYNDLSNKPQLFSGSYNDLLNKPTLFDGNYNSLSNRPTIPTAVSQLSNDSDYVQTSELETVAFSGLYEDLLLKPALFSGSWDDITNKPALFTGSYFDLTNKPTLFDGAYSSLIGAPTQVSTFNNDAGYITINDGYATIAYVDNSISSLVNGADAAFDTLKEIQDALATDTELANAISGLTIPSDISDLTDTTNLLDHFSGNYNDLTNKPTIPTVPTNVSAFTNDAGYITSFTDTTYSAGTGLDLTGTVFSIDNTVALKSEIPTIPTTVSSFTNDIGYITDYTVTQADVTAHQASLSVTESQITDLNNYVKHSTDDHVIPDTDNTWDLGSNTNMWRTIYGHTVEATYADLAERYAADAPYDEGTILVFGGETEVTVSTQDTDYRVAGIVSINPGLKLNSEAGNSQTHPYIALKGRVPCKVIGPVKKGDLLVTSATPGHARSCGGSDMGHAVLGKALVTDLSGGEKLIEVFVV